MLVYSNKLSARRVGKMLRKGLIVFDIHWLKDYISVRDRYRIK